MEQNPIHIVGFGAKSENAIAVLKDADLVYSRCYPVNAWLKTFANIDLRSMPAIMSESELDAAVDEMVSGWHTGKIVVYATLVQPLTLDTVVKRLQKHSPELHFTWEGGEDLVDDAMLAEVLESSRGMTILDGQDLAESYHLQFPSSQAALIYNPGEGDALAGLGKLLQAVYPSEHKVMRLTVDEDGNNQWQKHEIRELDHLPGSAAALLVPPRSPDSTLESFEEVIAHLRAPNGCPWDRKQTHESLRTYLLEETYEALSALDDNDLPGLKEELGDLLLQILLHAQIAVENGEFNMADVLEGINRKIVYRHPHVFGEVQVADARGVVQNWEKLKQQEREENGVDETKGLLDGIPLSFPALAQAQSIQDRVARVGFDWKEIGPVMDKVMEEYREVQEAANEEERAKELGDLLFAVVNLVRWYKTDAESALRETNLKFRKRFAYIEKRSRETGKPMQDMTLDEMDGYWNEAKGLL